MAELREIGRWASNRFRIFICEGQAKNQTAWGGRISFHDGLRYAQLLIRNSFCQLHLIPDSAATSLIVGLDAQEGLPEIDLVMVGTNGYDNFRFRHSAGHAMVVGAARLKELSEGSSARKTKCILVASDDKFVAESANEKDIKAQEVIRREGWRFRGPFGREPVRTQMFISQDPDLKSAYSGGIRPPVPIQSDHRFRGNPTTCSDLKPTTWSASVGRVVGLDRNPWSPCSGMP